MDYKKKINKHYNQLITKEGFNQAGLGWKSGKLEKRYKIFLDEINFNNKTILDFGGGFCYFFSFLKKKNIKFKNYICYEINNNIIEYLKKKNINVISKFPKKKYDTVIINGVYNYNYKSNKIVMFRDLKKIFNIAKKNIGISFLNSNVDYKERHLFYHNEKEVIDYLLSFSKKIKIIKTFSQFETFIIIDKE